MNRINADTVCTHKKDGIYVSCADYILRENSPYSGFESRHVTANDSNLLRDYNCNFDVQPVKALTLCSLHKQQRREVASDRMLYREYNGLWVVLRHLNLLLRDYHPPVF